MCHHPSTTSQEKTLSPINEQHKVYNMLIFLILMVPRTKDSDPYSYCHDLYLLQKWVPFLIYLLDFSKWDAKLKVLSSTLKWYKKNSTFAWFHELIHCQFFTKKSWNIHFAWEKSPTFARRSGLLIFLKFGFKHEL